MLASAALLIASLAIHYLHGSLPSPRALRSAINATARQRASYQAALQIEHANVTPWIQERLPRLPLPFMDPGFTQRQRDSVRRALLIVNNFGAYAAGPSAETMYAHPGVDFVAKNGTRVFAVASGVVRALRSDVEFYRSVIVESSGGIAWQYAHIDSFGVAVGDSVREGSYLGQVRFRGLEHLHLDKFRIDGTEDWSDRNAPRTHLNSIREFDIEEREAPIFAEEPIRFYANNGGAEFKAGRRGSTVIVQGDVDIAVAVRDPAPFARDKGYGDLHAVDRLEYEITGHDGVAHRRKSWDFSALALVNYGNRYFKKTNLQARVIFQFSPVPKGGTRTFAPSYIVTNYPADSTISRIDPDPHASLAWNTDERMPDGRRRWPDGPYRVTIRAWDAAGNTAAATRQVTVQNQSSIR
jgi:murein DD-endopeptidase MepM/ murein hydrolase activator NlpD